MDLGGSVELTMKSFYEMSNILQVSYTAVVLFPADRTKLLANFSIPEGFQPIAHHMTINMGAAANGPAAAIVGQKFKLTVVSIAQDEKVMAVGVETECPSTNKIKHITLAVNRDAGGKPFHSNQLKDWQPVSHIELNGFVAELGRGDEILSPMGNQPN